ncbi:MAG: FdhF/YdeP family oxidoreductase [Gemmataceae bacterium]
MKRVQSGGGLAAILYTLRMANKVGWWQLWRAMRSKNACKTCALGMGGQKGGMRNEAGHWPEFCKKSLQAMVADMQKGLEPRFFEKFSLAQLRAFSPRELEWCGRLKHPVYAGPGDTHYRAVSWEFALDRLVRQLKETPPDQHFFYASGRSSTEAGFLLQLFARLWGTNYVNNCSYYCHQASGVGLGQALGSGTASVSLEDVENTKLFVLIGGNPASNHPRMMRTLMQIRRRGGEVVVINPVRELGLVRFRVPSDVRSLLFGSDIASLYLQPHIGGDIALLTGVSKLLIERGQVDGRFLETATEGYEAFRSRVLATSWEEIEAGSGVDRQAITKFADVYARAESAVFGWTMGITHHEHGVENVRAIVNLALLRGMVGRPNAGVLPIRGHSNVQAMGSIGVTPQLRQDILNNLESHLKVQLPRTPGLDTMACMEASAAGRIRSALCLGGNLYGSNPDAQYAREALAKLDLVVYLNTTLNTGHAWGLGKETLVLPVLARDEEPQPTTQESMFNYVRLSDGGPARFEGPRSEVDILTTLGERVLGEGSPVAWRELGKFCHVREMIARIVPGWEKLAAIDQTKEEFHIPGRLMHTPRFNTPSGRAQFQALSLPARTVSEGELLLMTIRSEGQFNTVVYEEEDLYRGQDRRDIILLSAADVERLGLRPDQPVTVRSATGFLPNILVRVGEIRTGNAAMYFPEANVLVPRGLDPQSKTPAFKAVRITLETEAPTEPGPRRSLQVVPT